MAHKNTMSINCHWNNDNYVLILDVDFILFNFFICSSKWEFHERIYSIDLTTVNTPDSIEMSSERNGKRKKEEQKKSISFCSSSSPSTWFLFLLNIWHRLSEKWIMATKWRTVAVDNRTGETQQADTRRHIASGKYYFVLTQENSINRISSFHCAKCLVSFDSDTRETKDEMKMKTTRMTTTRSRARVCVFVFFECNLYFRVFLAMSSQV